MLDILCCNASIKENKTFNTDDIIRSINDAKNINLYVYENVSSVYGAICSKGDSLQKLCNDSNGRYSVAILKKDKKYKILLNNKMINLKEKKSE